MPLAKVQVPSPPKLEPVLGLIPLKNGQQVLTKEGKKHFFVPKNGGVFFPKKSAENVENNARAWEYYATGVQDIVDFRNQDITRHNDKLADMKLNTSTPWYRRIWGGAKDRSQDLF